MSITSFKTQVENQMRLKRETQGAFCVSNAKSQTRKSMKINVIYTLVNGCTRLPHGRPSKKRRFYSLHSICRQNASLSSVSIAEGEEYMTDRWQCESTCFYAKLRSRSMLEYTSASIHSICTSSALPSDLLRRSSAVVIKQAQWFGASEYELILLEVQWLHIHVQIMVTFFFAEIKRLKGLEIQYKSSVR